jgi:hypothetical protein
MLETRLGRSLNPQITLTVLMVTFLLYVASPFVYWSWLRYQLESGAFPLDADSIGIPMAGFLLLWFVAGFLAALVGLLLIVWRIVLVPSGQKV